MRGKRSSGRGLTDQTSMMPDPRYRQDPFADLPSPTGRETALYVHIPFCPSRCTYCSFVSSSRHSEPDRDDYLGLVCREADYLAQRGLFAGRTASLIQIGGGTPAVLSPRQLRRLTGWLAGLLPVENDLEFTCEGHPLTLLGREGHKRLVALKEGGVNRLSIGVQDFNPAVLQACERRHTLEDVREALQQARAAGFGNINLDFIYGLPGQTADTWLQTLSQAVELRPECITAYRVGLRSGTPMALRDVDEFPDQDCCAQMRQSTIAVLTRGGYGHALFSHFAAPGYMRYDQFALPGYTFRYEEDLYLPTRDIIGMGVSAYSSLADRGHRNHPSRDRYAQAATRGGCVVEASVPVDATQRQAVTVVLALRRPSKGLDRAEFRAHFGQELNHEYGRVIEDLAERGLVDDDADRVRLTERGLFSADEINAVLVPLYDRLAVGGADQTPRVRRGSGAGPTGRNRGNPNQLRYDRAPAKEVRE